MESGTVGDFLDDFRLSANIFVQGNCLPRLPASHFLVRKEGANKGRWFYTCQEQKENGCGFFLWDDDAVGREMNAVIQNSRSEPDVRKTMVDSAADTTLNKSKFQESATPSSRPKSIPAVIDAEDDEFGDWPLTIEEELHLSNPNIPISPPSALGSSKEITPIAEPKTTQNPARRDAVVTPGSKRIREAIPWPTPQTHPSLKYELGKDEDIFTSPSKKLKGGILDGNNRPALMSLLATPTPGRFRDILIENKTTAMQETPPDYDITQEVMELLQDQTIDDDKTVKLRSILNRYALKTSGISRGRDITRLALKTKDATIAELKQRINALETERSMDKAVIKHIKSDMAHIIPKR
jgi:hypothetical protein